jgi:hypothetical protein
MGVLQLGMPEYTELKMKILSSKLISNEIVEILLRQLSIYTTLLTQYFFFFLHVRTRGEMRIRTSDLRFIRHSPSQLSYLLEIINPEFTN